MNLSENREEDIKAATVILATRGFLEHKRYLNFRKNFNASNKFENSTSDLYP